MTIQMIQHADHMADSYMGDVRVVRRGRGWALAVRQADGGEWGFSAPGRKAEILMLAVAVLPFKYPGMYINS
jgi:hypothetical protein